MPLHKNQTIPLTIESLSNDGNGVGHYNEQVIFVPHLAVGDVLTVKIVKPSKRYAYGRIERVVTPGPGRIEPDCPISGHCGGCAFRHVSYDAELEAKHLFVKDALQRIGGITAEVLPVIPSPLVSRYRNKVQYPVMANLFGELVYGFYANRSHRVIPCNNCLLQPEQLNQIAARATALLQQLKVTAYNEATHRGLVRHIYLRQSVYSGEIMVCLVINGKTIPDAHSFATTLQNEFPAIKTVVLNINTTKGNVICGPDNKVLVGDGTINDRLAGVPLHLHPLSFSQVNTPAAEQLFEIVNRLAAPTKQDSLLDLYCGTGVIGLSMAKNCKELVGVEVVPQAIESAKQSAKEMNLDNTRFLCANAGQAAAALAQEGIRPTVVTVDPPRKGCDAQTLQALVTIGSQRIVMVSCNPASLARDLAYLAAKGYQLNTVQPVDLFPRTRHVETVALLTCENTPVE